jgi:hypothetical protein
MIAKDYILNKLIIESLLKNGSVTIEEAEFYNRITGQIFNKIASELITENDINEYISASKLKNTQTKNIEETSTATTNEKQSIVAKLLK